MIFCPLSARRLAVVVCLSGIAASVCSGATLFTDNFNTANTGSLDGSDQTGRHTGVLANDIVLRSGGVQHSITDNRLDFLLAGGADGRVRIHNANDLGNLWDFAAGVGGTQILAGGGLRIEFDWTPADNTSGDWVSFSIGINGLDSAFRVAVGPTDFGILFRNNGGTQLFDNGIALDGPQFAVATLATHHALIDYKFSSFADGQTVNMQSSVDGVPVTTAAFQWDGNGGVINMEFGNLAQGTKLDNVSISTVPEPSSMLLLGTVAVISSARRRRLT
jgi:hypothetical protein